MSNIQQIKQISIRAYLAEQGLHPVKNNPRYGLYLSPLREEHSPSFKVDYMQNLWYDFGLGEGGSIIDLVMRMERCNAGEAMRRLERHIDGMQTSPLSPSGFSSSRLGEAIQNCSALAPQRRFIGKNPAPQRPPSIVVVQVRPLDNPALLAYLTERGIDLAAARAHSIRRGDIVRRCIIAWRTNPISPSDSATMPEVGSCATAISRAAHRKPRQPDVAIIRRVSSSRGLWTISRI